MANLSSHTTPLKVELKKANLDEIDVDAVIVFSTTRDKKSKKAKREKKRLDAEKSDLKVGLIEGVSKNIISKFSQAAEDGGLTGSNHEALLLRSARIGGAKHLLSIGLGKSDDIDHERLRQAAAVIVNTLKGAKIKSAAIALDSLPHHTLNANLVVQALTEGAMMASYTFEDFKQKKNTENFEKLLLVSSHKAKGNEEGLEAGDIIADCVNFARWLGDRPGNRMTPAQMAEEAFKAAKGTKLRVNAWDRSRIKSEKMGSFLSVSLGSTQEPRFIVMEYSNAAPSKAPICFVGKGLTFDSGGISIKPSASMEEMKYDMCGGANVIATMLAIARLKLKINAIGLVPATENMPGPSANKPGDVVIARNGKSIEVNNTDAEGRLILADALVYACEQKPAAIYDIATLTGAMLVALGNIHTGYFTRHDKLDLRIQEAVEASGELNIARFIC